VLAANRACRADKAALGRMRRPKPAKLARCERLRRVVEAKLELRWSPQQISGWLVGAFPDQVNRPGFGGGSVP
jgi:transposase, IS30 family